MRRLLMCAVVGVWLASCESDPKPAHERPGGEGHGTEVVNVDISAELADDAMRVVLPDTVVAYDSGGVIFGCTKDGCHFAVNVGSGWRADFNAGAVELKVNGRVVPVKDASVAKKQGNTTWYVATPVANPDKRIIWVTKW